MMPPMASPVAPDVTERVACVSCGSGDADPLLSAPCRDPGCDPQVRYQVVRCRGCGLAFLHPRPDAEQLAAFYPEGYYAYQPTVAPAPRGLKALGHWLEWAVKMGLRQAFFGYPVVGGRLAHALLQGLLWPMWLRMRLLGKDLKVIPYRGRGRFLEVGCGSGSELAYQRRYGLTATGVEPSASAARAARERHRLDVRTGTLAGARFPDGAFDTIYMSHVFEHLPDPAAALEEMRRILDADGLIILKVPNMASESAERFGPCWLGIDAPRHLYHFTPETLAALVQRHGFAVERIRQDVSSWSFWRESRRCAPRRLSGGERIPADAWRRDWRDQWAERLACRRGRGSVLVVYARKIP